MKKILITGNLGYVGSTLTNHLAIKFPSSVLDGFDTGYFAHCLTDVKQIPERALNKQYFADIRDVKEQHLSDVDIVVHLSAISNDPMGQAFAQPTLDVNFQATEKLAKMAKQCGVSKFIFASSCSMYGAGGSDIKNENSELAPLTAYAHSKCQSESMLSNIADKSFQVICLRFATACGMSPRLRLDLVLNDFVASGLVNHKIEVLSDGTPWRPLIHVADMARAIEWAVDYKPTSFLAINVGSDQWNYQIKELAGAVAQYLNVPLTLNTQASPDNRSYRVSFEKFSQLAPNHLPIQTLEQAIQGLVEGLSSFNDTNFRQGNLMRLHTLEQHINENKLNANLRWNCAG